MPRSNKVEPEQNTPATSLRVNDSEQPAELPHYDEPTAADCYGSDDPSETVTAEHPGLSSRSAPSSRSTSTTSNLVAVEIPPSVFEREYETEVCEEEASMREARRISGLRGGRNGGGSSSHNRHNNNNGTRSTAPCCSRISVPFSVVLVVCSIVLVVAPCTTVWVTSHNRADSSINAVSNSLVESLEKNVHDIVDGFVNEVDASLAAEVEWLRYRHIDMNSWAQWASELRPRYVHFAINSPIHSIYLRSPNLTIICTGRLGANISNCARKTNASDGLNFYNVDAETNAEVKRTAPIATTPYVSYSKVMIDGVYDDMLRGVPNWGRVVTVLMSLVVMSSYHPYMSSSGELLGVIQGAKAVTSLSNDLRDIAAGQNVIYVTTNDGTLLGSSNGSVVTYNATTYLASTVLANNSNNPVVAAIAREVELLGGCANVTEKTQFNVKVNGSTYTVAIAHIAAGQRVWCGVAAIPSSEMTETIEEGKRVSIIVFVCSLVVSLVIAMILALFLVLPLKHLTKDMRNLSQLRFKPLGRTVSIFTELHSMLRDYMAMKQGIHAFSRYVSAGVVRQLLDGEHKMSSLYLERHTVTVVFMDVVGFTSLCEKLAPNTLVTLLSLFMQRMCQVLISEGATLDKFIGDCIMSFWNHPQACEDHAFKAVKAVLRCYEELEKLNKENASKGLPEVHFRAGINTGRVLVGNFGSPERFDYTVLGDTVNVAARLEQLNRELNTRILISEGVFNMVGARIPTHPMGQVSIRGRQAKVDVYEVVVAAPTTNG